MKIQSNNNEVICPNCVHQFRAIPVNIQQLLLQAGVEPPFLEGRPCSIPEFDSIDDDVIDLACEVGGMYRVDLMHAWNIIRFKIGELT